MRKLIMTTLLMAAMLTATAQTAREEIGANPWLAGSNYVDYDRQLPDFRYTKPPKGYVPFYFSHYGRHGSRWLIGGDDYERVLRPLLKGSQSIIIVLARKMYKVIPDELKEPLAQNRLLIISVCNAIRQSKATAMIRNKYVCEMADKILFVGVTEQSSLYTYKKEYRNKIETNIH